MGGKPSRSMEVRVGALVLAALVLLIGFVLLLGDFRCGERADVVIDYRNSGDLKVGAPVKVSGVTVGKVAAVELRGGRPDPLRDGKPVFVRVTVRIDAAAHAMLHEDAGFLITTLGVLGERYVEIDPGSPDKPALAAGKVVDGVAPVRIEAIASEAGALVADIKEVLGENREDVRAIVKKTRGTVDHV
ncbi:MAG: MCE family protein, partial [Deltaproteobacteria bacterium]|nr:MCE family protein [Deltaproteobacteria bacterium]